MDLLQIILSKLSNIRSYVTILHMEINSMKDDKYSLQKYNKQLRCALDTSVGHNKVWIFNACILHRKLGIIRNMFLRLH